MVSGTSQMKKRRGFSDHLPSLGQALLFLLGLSALFGSHRSGTIFAGLIVMSLAVSWSQGGLAKEMDKHPILSRVLATVATLMTLGYLIPWVIAVYRRHSKAGAIFTVNFFFGWTIAGWIVALIWAIKAPGQATQVGERQAA